MEEYNLVIGDTVNHNGSFYIAVGGERCSQCDLFNNLDGSCSRFNCKSAPSRTDYYVLKRVNTVSVCREKPREYPYIVYDGENEAAVIDFVDFQFIRKDNIEGRTSLIFDNYGCELIVDLDDHVVKKGAKHISIYTKKEFEEAYTK